MSGSGRDRPAPNGLPQSQARIRALAVLGLGLVVGLGFTLPVLAYVRTPPGTARTVAVLVAAAAAMLLIRRLGAILRRLLDSLPQPWRLPLLAAYAMAAMALPASLLVLQPGPAATSRPGGAEPVPR